MSRPGLLSTLLHLRQGQDFEIVNQQLRQYVINSQFDRDINVDAIRYLAKCQLGLI